MLQKSAWGSGKKLVFEQPKASAAELRKAAGLLDPEVSGSSNISSLWHYCNAEGKLAYDAVPNAEIELFEIKQSLTKLLGAGARIYIGDSYVNVANAAEIVIFSEKKQAYDDKSNELLGVWQEFAQIIQNGIGDAIRDKLTITQYLDLNGFDQVKNPGSTRVRHFGDGVHITYSVFGNVNMDQKVGSAGQIFQLGNMHVTQELHGRDSRNNPHYYHNGIFNWIEGKRRYEAEVELLTQKLLSSRGDVIRICRERIEDYGTSLKK